MLPPSLSAILHGSLRGTPWIFPAFYAGAGRLCFSLMETFLGSVHGDRLMLRLTRESVWKETLEYILAPLLHSP